MQNDSRPLSRRFFLRNALSAGAMVAGAGSAQALGMARTDAMSRSVLTTSPRVIRPALLRAALAALSRHGGTVPNHDRIAVADFAAPSATPRFHFVDMANGATTTMLVAHGRGSDPAHTGWVQRFSNDPGSQASSDGAFLTADYYAGKHGRSQRLIGLDRTNDNALSRAIVVHSAWYVNPDMITSHGQLGRSEGCFAVGEADLERVFALLGPGRMLFSAKA